MALFYGIVHHLLLLFFSVGTNTGTNGSGHACIAYCFASIEGYSKVGSYLGNGNVDGPFIYTGFRTAYVMLKKYTEVKGWGLQDGVRDPFNPTQHTLSPDTNIVEYVSTSSGDHYNDYLSNGFKARDTNSRFNTSGQSYLYIAFAESPFKTSNAR